MFEGFGPGKNEEIIKRQINSFHSHCVPPGGRGADPGGFLYFFSTVLSGAGKDVSLKNRGVMPVTDKYWELCSYNRVRGNPLPMRFMRASDIPVKLAGPSGPVFYIP